jgi:hypothetical protein
VRQVRLPGIFNPISLEGNLVVDGVAASAFTSHGANFSPSMSHACLALLRAWYRLHRASYLAAHDSLAAMVLWLAKPLLALGGS